MKKGLLVFGTAMCLLFASAQTSSAETGIGLQFGEPTNVGLSVRLDNIALGIGWSFSGDGFLAIDADYWLMKNNLSQNLDWFAGLGVGVRLGSPLDLGARVPIGLQWMAAKNIEVFGQIVPELQIIDELKFKFGGAIGVRVIL